MIILSFEYRPVPNILNIPFCRLEIPIKHIGYKTIISIYSYVVDWPSITEYT